MVPSPVAAVTVAAVGRAIAETALEFNGPSHVAYPESSASLACSLVHTRLIAGTVEAKDAPKAAIVVSTASSLINSASCCVWAVVDVAPTGT